MRATSLRKVAGSLLATLAVALATAAIIIVAGSQNGSTLKHQADATLHDLMDIAGIEQESAIDWSAQPENVIAWIRIPDTCIDYPIMQATADDPDFYLYHDEYGNYDPYGTPFVSSECSEGLASPNVIICAHHMADGTMFASVAEYSDAAFAQERQEVIITTRASTMHLKVMAARIIDASSEGMDASFADKVAYATWIGRINASADMQLTPLDGTKQTFALSTCSYTTYYNERTLVYLQ